ncbi:MAG: hypothetical protein IPH32_04965 [Bacteroidetes bacterium]|nr:hypothetical protein [Bacteroidota bacterium]
MDSTSNLLRNRVIKYNTNIKIIDLVVDSNIFILFEYNSINFLKSSSKIISLNNSLETIWEKDFPMFPGGLLLKKNRLLFSFSEKNPNFLLGIGELNTETGEMIFSKKYSKAPNKGGSSIGLYDFKLNLINDSTYYFLNLDNEKTKTNSPKEVIKESDLQPNNSLRVCILDDSLLIRKLIPISSNEINYNLRIYKDLFFYLNNIQGNNLI